MTDLNRRDLLAATAAVGAVTVLPLGAPSADAAVPPAAAQAPGFYRYKVGAYECTSINDGARSFPTRSSRTSRRKRCWRQPKRPTCPRAW